MPRFKCHSPSIEALLSLSLVGSSCPLLRGAEADVCPGCGDEEGTEDDEDDVDACKPFALAPSLIPALSLQPLPPPLLLLLLLLPLLSFDDEGSAVVASAGEEEGTVAADRSPDTSACQSKSMTAVSSPRWISV